MTDNSTFEELTQMAIDYFDSKSLDQIKTMILEMEHFERELFKPTNTTNKSRFSWTIELLLEFWKYWKKWSLKVLYKT